MPDNLKLLSRKKAATFAIGSPEKVSRGIDNEPPSKRHCSAHERGGFSRVSEVANSSKLRHDVVGKVLMVGKEVEHIPIKTCHLLKFAYILGASDGTVEVTSVGSLAPVVAAEVTKLLHKPVAVRRAVWNPKNQVLTHKPGTTVELCDDDMMEDGEGVEKWILSFRCLKP